MALKTLNITLEDQDYEKLSKVKGSRTWKHLLLSLINPDLESGADCSKVASSGTSLEKNLSA